MTASCSSVPSHSIVAQSSISVDQPEIFDNSSLQSQLDNLRGQLAQLGIIDTTTLTSALGNVQGTSISQSNVSLQLLVPASGASATPAAPAAPAAATAPPLPTLPGVASSAIGLIDKQMELESQLQGYQLLLGGSDFARYTRVGLSKDRIVIGFPISINPRPAYKNMAAVVEITYFPPNSGQFPEPGQCEQRNFTAKNTGATSSKPELRYSREDEVNASVACEEQEATPTVINILPTQRSYDVVGVSSSAQTVGAGAIIGTVNVGLSGGVSKQTQFLVAQQDTVALQGHGVVRCTSELIDVAVRANLEHCVLGSRGISFQWQFRPVLGESYVRAGTRRTFVQLAVPNVRRPYPNYGGIVYVKTVWRPYNQITGVVSEPEEGGQRELSQYGADLDSQSGPIEDKGPVTVKNVFGHTFVSSEVTDIETFDQGGGLLQVSLRGRFLTGATVRIGATLLTPTTPGFVTDYNSLRFLTSAQALAQNGAFLISSEGVETHIGLDSICKGWDPQYECSPGDAEKPKISAISVFPVSDSTSLVEVKLNQTLHLAASLCAAETGPPECAAAEDRGCVARKETVTDYKTLAYPAQYYHYERDPGGDVKGDLAARKSNSKDPRPFNACKLVPFINKLPIILSVGGKAFGLSDQPFQSRFFRTSRGDEGTIISVVATNDSLNASPQVSVQTLFGLPDSDPDPQYFVPPGRVTVSPDPIWMQAHAPKTPVSKSSDMKLTALLIVPSSSGATKPSTSTQETAAPVTAGQAHPIAASKSDPQPAAQPESKPQVGGKPDGPCDSKNCHYVVSGSEVEDMFIDPVRSDCEYGCSGRSHPDVRYECRDARLGETSPLENNSRGLTAPLCARQVTLSYPIGDCRDHCPIGQLIVSLGAKPVTTPASPSLVTPKSASLVPHFSLTRAVQQVSESGGTASITVGIQNLKDQTATVTVNSADIVSAKDGAGNSLPVLVGNNVVVTQDTLITFQVRNFTLGAGLNVSAEGKNGSVSAGSVSFSQPFLIQKDATNGGSNAPKSTP